MPQLWDAQISISEDEAASLIAEQFPVLAPVTIQTIGSGWDNTAYLVNGEYVFRFPRRHVAVNLLDIESVFLPSIAAHLPLSISAPLFVGTPTPDYPYPFMGYPYLVGKTACQFTWTDEERARNAVLLAQFLAALHLIPLTPEILATAPGDTIARANLPERAIKVEERLQRRRDSLPDLDVDALIRLTQQLAATPWTHHPVCWVHGDLYARHLIMDDETKTLCGVIDWGDLHLGDPAIDLSIAFTFLPPDARPLFRQTYGEIDEDTWNRARFRALHYGAVLIDYGKDIEDETIAALGYHALSFATFP